MGTLNPTTAVIYGAALQSGFLSKEKRTRDVIVVDINPLIIQVKNEAGQMKELLPSNKIISTKTSEVFSTAVDDQLNIILQIFEGENILGELELIGIPPAPRGVPKIEVIFLIDINGILTVSAVDKTTENQNTIIINSNISRLSPEEINRMIKDSEKYANEDKKVKERIDIKNELELYTYSLKTQINDKENLGEKLSIDEKKTIESAVKEQIKWLESNQSAEVDELKEHKKQLEEIVTPIITKLYGHGRRPANPVDMSHSPHEHDDDSL